MSIERRRSPSLVEWVKTQGLTLVVWVFLGGVLYQQVQSNTNTLNARTTAVEQLTKTVIEVATLRRDFDRGRSTIIQENEKFMDKFDTFLEQQNSILLMVTTNKVRIDGMQAIHAGIGGK
jgi:hypothetical protein